MPIETEIIDNHRVCRISGELCIWEAAGLWRQLHQLLSIDQPLLIDLSAVNACDTAGLQILCQIGQTARNKRREIQMAGLSAVIAHAMQQAGMNPQTFTKPAGD